MAENRRRKKGVKDRTFHPTEPSMLGKFLIILSSSVALTWYMYFAIADRKIVATPPRPQILDTGAMYATPSSCAMNHTWPDQYTLVREFDSRHPNFTWPNSPSEARGLEKLLWAETIASVNHTQLTRDSACLHNVLTQYTLALNDLKGRVPVQVKYADQQVNCKATEFEHFLSGDMRSSPAKIVDIMVMAHELDVAEIRFLETRGLVDLVVLVEGTCTHRGFRKSLFWEHVRHSPRFRVYDHLVKHLVIDDGVCLSKVKETDHLHEREVWGIEPLPWKLALRLAGEIVGTGYETIVIVSDMDEFPSRNTLNHIKHCSFANGIAGVRMNYSFFYNHFDVQGHGVHGYIGPIPPSNQLHHDFRKNPTEQTWWTWVKELGKAQLRMGLITSAWHLRGFGGPTITMYKHTGQAEGYGIDANLIKSAFDNWWNYERGSGNRWGQNSPHEFRVLTPDFVPLAIAGNSARYPWSFILNQTSKGW
eukprot:m.115202 g.115202  ORF g.115202 m.115202 type:complete len:477 (+) comp28405_c2_seq1:108-1538(+)